MIISLEAFVGWRVAFKSSTLWTFSESSPKAKSFRLLSCLHLCFNFSTFFLQCLESFRILFFVCFCLWFLSFFFLFLYIRVGFNLLWVNVTIPYYIYACYNPYLLNHENGFNAAVYFDFSSLNLTWWTSTFFEQIKVIPTTIIVIQKIWKLCLFIRNTGSSIQDEKVRDKTNFL